MRRFWNQPLRRQLVIAILLLLVPVLGAAIWSGLVTFREYRQDLGNQARIIASTTAAFISRDVDNLDAMAEGLAATAPVVAGDGPRATTILTGALAGHPVILQAILVDRNGRQLARAQRVERELDEDTWAPEVVRTGTRVTLPSGLSDPVGPRYVVLGYPVRDASGAVTGALGLFVDIRTLDDAFEALPSLTVFVSIADLNGRILVRNTDSARFVGEYLYGVRRSQPGVLPAAERRDLDGVNRMYAEALAERGPWLVSVGLPVRLATGRAASLWARSFTILLIGLFGWLGVAYVLSRRLVHAVSHLDGEAQRIAGGDFAPLQQRPMLSREFVQLQDAFDMMLKRFNQTRVALDAQMAEERGIRKELESLQGQVIRQERLAAVGQLVSGVAHEINNPLQAILGFAELLQMRKDVSEPVKADLHLIQKESARACAIIRNLALFARQQPGQAAPIKMGDVIAAVAELRQRRLESEDIELRIENTSVLTVMAVAAEIQQVVLNFVINAEQAILGSGRLPGRVTIRARDGDGIVILEVEDTGPGVPPEHESKLFQPFFTTKAVGQGTGLGLSVSYGIIDSRLGHIGYRRAPAGGAVFYFDLPAAPAQR